jgi:hypothetical protein
VLLSWLLGYEDVTAHRLVDGAWGCNTCTGTGAGHKKSLLFDELEDEKELEVQARVGGRKSSASMSRRGKKSKSR